MHIQRSEPGAREARREHGLGDPELGSVFDCRYCNIDQFVFDVILQQICHSTLAIKYEEQHLSPTVSRRQELISSYSSSTALANTNLYEQKHCTTVAQYALGLPFSASF